MKKLIGIALIASTLYSCGNTDNQKAANQNNATLQTELAQAKQENEILKLQHELEMLKTQQQTADPARLAVPENSNARYAYFGNALPTDARRTQPVDNEWTEHEMKSTDVHKTGETTPTAETKPASANVKKKKGLSTPVKGALIGAGVGAATGAVVAKNNRVKGAVVGAVVGAGAGAGTGVIIDKRKEKKAESTPYFATNSFLK